MNTTSFKITGGKGFHITFKNGVTVSVQFGGGNYCDYYDDEISREAFKKQGSEGSYEAEIAIFNKGGFITQEFEGKDNGGVMGWVDVDKVLEALNWANKYRESK
jgi:hypothetical protein